MVGAPANPAASAAGGKRSACSTLKFLCSYGGKILPRYTDGKLRYLGGETRVLAVQPFISFSELFVKLSELYGAPVSVRCQLPTDDLDALVSITSDEDLANLLEEYDRVNDDREVTLKVRTFLWRYRAKTPSPPCTAESSPTTASRPPSANCCFHKMDTAAALVRFPFRSDKFARDLRYSATYPFFMQANPKMNYTFFVHNGNYWQ